MSHGNVGICVHRGWAGEGAELTSWGKLAVVLSGLSFLSATTRAEENSKVVIYYPAVPYAMDTAHIAIDGKKTAALGHDRKFTVSLPAGKHVFSAGRIKLMESQELTWESILVSGKTYYLKLEIVPSSAFLNRRELTPDVDERAAAQRIEKFRPIKPKEIYDCSVVIDPGCRVPH